MHSIARFHPLVDGNTRLAWLATATFCEINGASVITSNDQAYELIMAVAEGELSEVHDIAKALKAADPTSGATGLQDQPPRRVIRRNRA